MSKGPKSRLRKGSSLEAQAARDLPQKLPRANTILALLDGIFFT